MASGWYKDSYRHSLAARGIDLKRYQGKYRQVSVNKTPWFQKGCKDVRAEYRVRKDGKVDVINTCEKDGKQSSAKGVARSVSPDNRKLKVSFFPPFEGDYEIKSIDKDYNNVTVQSGDTEWKLKRIANAAKEDQYRYIGDKDQHPKDFIMDNTKAVKNDHRLEDFWSGAQDVLFYPGNDLDDEWQSYNQAAGNGHIKLSDNHVERAQERGAALVGRVVTLANVEPMLDHDKGRSFRETMVDIEFGRNMGKKPVRQEIKRPRRQAMAYVPTYVASDVAPIAGDAVGTAGAAAVTMIPLAVGAGVIYLGARHIKKQYDKDKKEIKKRK